MSKRNRNKNDISIGQDRWIEWVELGDQQKNAIDIDKYVNELGEFWEMLETNCVHECCGIDAFDLWPASVHKAACSLINSELKKRLEILSNRIANLDGQVLVSHRLNNYFHKSVFQALLQHLIQCSEQANES
jgi:hypothetical protein